MKSTTISIPGSPLAWFVVILLLGVGWVLGFGFARDFWSEQTAAWVQAFGSIAAIAGGFAVARYTMDQAGRAAEADARATAIAVAKTAVEHARLFWVASFRGDPNAPDIRVFSRTRHIELMSRLQITLVRDPTFIADYIELQATTDELFKRCNRFAGWVENPPKWFQEATEKERIALLKDRMLQLYGYLESGRPGPWVPPKFDPADAPSDWVSSSEDAPRAGWVDPA